MTNPALLTRAQLASIVDHTALAPETTEADVEALSHQARELGVYAVCVSPSLVRVAARELTGSGIAVAGVVGFPSGAHPSAVKAFEAAGAVAEGAVEIDMVIDLGMAFAGRWEEVRADIAEVRDAAPAPVVLKVIIESAALSVSPSGTSSLVAACRTAEAAGADFVKTSTGFHPAGGATTQAVRLMAETVGARLGVKASGGIRDADQALAMVTAGATRLGLSRTVSILAGPDHLDRKQR